MKESDVKNSSSAAPSGRKHQIVNRFRGVQPAAFSTAKDGAPFGSSSIGFDVEGSGDGTSRPNS
ncbi:MAG: hypothetical protein KDD67_09795 [Ignavibacteriae bacterium]|nr:hypothetical protein [Ignavibacteriota bacterium]